MGVIGLTIVHLVKSYAFASVWCFYAAVPSVVLYQQFYRQDIDVAKRMGLARCGDRLRCRGCRGEGEGEGGEARNAEETAKQD